MQKYFIHLIKIRIQKKTNKEKIYMFYIFSRPLQNQNDFPRLKMWNPAINQYIIIIHLFLDINFV